MTPSLSMQNLLDKQSNEKAQILVSDWARGYESQPNEYSYWISEIQGEIPKNLVGTLFRNGAALFDINGQRIGHPFDGDGMICAIAVQDGKAHFRNRFVRTKGYLEEKKAGKILYRGFGTQKSGGWLTNIFDTTFKNAANTNVILWQDNLYALWEGGQPHRLDPYTLETLGLDDLDGVLTKGQAFSAHPRTINHQFVNFGVKPGLSSTLTIFEWNSHGKLLTQQSHDFPGFAFLHDMAVTPNNCIFVQNPFAFDSLSFLLGLKSIDQCLTFDPKQPTRFIVVSRDGKQEMTMIETDPFFVFHHNNAWEAEGKIYLESVCYDRFPSVESKSDFRQVDFATLPRGELSQFTIDLSTKNVTSQPLEIYQCEFPSVNPHYVGYAHRYLYLNVADHTNIPAPLQAIMKIDKQTGEKQIWSAAPRGFAGEPVFVPFPDAIAEDDGWILSLVYDASAHRSYLVILDARDLTQEIARLHLEHHVPHGFHGNWSDQVFLPC